MATRASSRLNPSKAVDEAVRAKGEATSVSMPKARRSAKATVNAEGKRKAPPGDSDNRRAKRHKRSPVGDVERREDAEGTAASQFKTAHAISPNANESAKIPSNRLIEPMLPQRAFRLTAPAPTRERKTREFCFNDSELAKTLKFRPNVSPEEMLRAGVFGGSYFRPYFSHKLDREFHEDWLDLPPEWYSGLDVDRCMTAAEQDPEANRWKVKVGQSIEEWEKANWIAHEHDVRGWFQWYCRFFMGRRCDDDERQMKRWSGVAGPKGRWRTIYLGKYVNARVNEILPDEENISPGIRQTILHWGFEVSTTHLNLFKLDKGIHVRNDGDSQEESD